MVMRPNRLNRLGEQIFGRAGGAVPAVPSAITSLTVMTAGGLVADAVDGADAADPNGWVAKVTLPDDGVSVFDPTKIALQVADPGFAPNGGALSPVAGGPVRTITGTAVVRKQWPNNAQRLNSAAGGSRTVYFALSDEIYAGSVILSATASAGYYGAAAAGAISGSVNNSTLAYPKPLFAWINAQHERATGAGFNVEAVAYHGLARNGQQVAAIRFTARDAAGNFDNANAQICSAPSLSAMQTQGPIVEAWKATIPLANLPQADLCHVNAEVLPWIGDASAVLNLAVDGIATAAGSALSTVNPQTPLRFCCDKNGTYGGAIAYVRPTGTLVYSGTNGATTPVTGVFTGAQVGLTNAQCYADLLAAFAALKNWNNVNRGHNDHSGSTAYLTDDGAGGAVVHVLGNQSGITAGKCLTDVRVDPAATGAVSLQIGTISTTQSFPADLTRFRVNTTQIGYMRGNTFATNRLCWDGCTVTGSGAPAGSVTRETMYSHFKNVTLVGLTGNVYPIQTSANLKFGSHAIGVIADANGTKTNAHVLIGCSLSRSYFAGYDTATFPAAEDLDGAVYANTKFLNAPQYCNFESSATVRGLALANLVIERPGTGGNPALQIHGDGADKACKNIVIHHVTTIGHGSPSQGRTNLLYAVKDTTVGVQRSGYMSFNLFQNFNRKTDTFTGLSTATGRTGNWKFRYGVAQLGNVAISGSQQDGPNDVNTSGDTWLGEARDAFTNFAGINTTFTDDEAGTTQGGGGTYSLSGASNDAYDRVPGGRGVLKYDLAGALRKQDGTGAAGAYERTDI